ncbi:MAG: FmdE, Molybdenum formylmethanofuran dehydrogenase operon [Methanoregulaceae archaeon PtaB.Bin056]|jgi:formylmethanofuran dehydrogenase subunit E-like metal-binding protein|nr:MAG: FmdE, Molybdenum formylmethanofuran dehydrogenase operon [Methanoregulaceae archaeon PtaB.Bin056]
MNTHQKFLFALLIAALLCAPALASLPDANRMEEIGQRAAYTALSELQFSKGDPGVMVLTNAGRAVVNGQTTERAISGITKISGLQNGDSTLWTVNRAEWKPLWFYFYNKYTGKGLFLEPDTAVYTMSKAEFSQVSFDDTFSTRALVIGDLLKIIADSDVGNQTRDALGGESNSIISITNAWAHGAPYDLMAAAMLHNHLCPGLLGGYFPIKYVEKVLPIENSAQSYTYITTSTSCKEDAYPVLWDMTPGKGGAIVHSLSENETAALKEEYGSSPRGIFVRWDSRAKSGTGIVFGSVTQASTAENNVPEWAAKPYRVVMSMATIDKPELSVSTLKTFTIDQETLSELKSAANPYSVIANL